MLEIGILGSTRGTDLSAIVESINKGKLKDLAEIAIIISDREDSRILEKAKKYEIKHYYLSTWGKEREHYDKEIASILDEHNVELITLIGYMRLFSSWFVKKYKNKIMNIHPSLLPSFPGMDRNIHKNVLEYGCKVSGCTLFFVDEGKDTGPIIMQKAVSVYENDNIDTLKARVQKAEQEIYPEAIRLYALEKLKIKGRKVIVEK